MQRLNELKTLAMKCILQKGWHKVNQEAGNKAGHHMNISEDDNVKNEGSEGDIIVEMNVIAHGQHRYVSRPKLYPYLHYTNG